MVKVNVVMRYDAALGLFAKRITLRGKNKRSID
jgi:hypothetical protein